MSVLEITLVPVHITMISGCNLLPIVLRYSELLTFGIAREAQYSVGQNMNSGLLSAS